jgi:type VI secretion system protein ImpJ
MLPALEAVLRSPTVPPHALYLALCMQIGSLSMLCPGSVPLLPPAWTHADPLAAFGPVLEYLEEAAARVSQEWRTELFRYEEGAFLRDLPLEGTGKRIVVGLRGRSERELTAWMMSAVIGSQTVWTSLSDRRVLGAAREPIREAAELGLRAGGDHVLFGIEVSADFVIPGQALVISNLNETDVSQRPQELVLFTRG